MKTKKMIQLKKYTKLKFNSKLRSVSKKIKLNWKKTGVGFKILK